MSIVGCRGQAIGVVCAVTHVGDDECIELAQRAVPSDAFAMGTLSPSQQGRALRQPHLHANNEN